jgi:anti-anti-sigma factor
MAALETRIDTTETWDRGCQITLAGEIRRWDAFALQEELLYASDRGAVVTVVDLSDVTYLDQIAFAVLLDAAGNQHDLGGQLFIATRARSRLGYVLRPLSADDPDTLRGLHPAVDRALQRHVQAEPK